MFACDTVHQPLGLKPIFQLPPNGTGERALPKTARALSQTLSPSVSSPSPPACHVNMLHAFHGAHVLRALEGPRIRASQLAHAALHLHDGFVLVLLHPVAQFALDMTQMIHA